MDVAVLSGRIAGRIRVPGSKSIAQRALVLATRKGGIIRNVPESMDIDRLCEGLRALGFRVDQAPGERTVSGGFSALDAQIDVGDNGTAGRCLTALASLREATTVIDGSARLRRRPIKPLCDALRQLGARVEGDTFPLTVTGPIQGGTVHISTEVSSQFATAFILIVDRVKGLRVNVTGKQSFAYVSLTAFVQRGFKSPYEVEPDFSSAAGLAVAAATTGGDLLLEGLTLSSPQPDARIFPFLNKAGAQVTEEDGGIRVRGDSLKGVRADVANCPDLASLLGAMGALAEGETVVTGAPHLVHKESNRIHSTVDMIRDLGGEADPLEDGFRITGGQKLSGAPISSAGDHRIAMAAAVLALSVPGVTVTGAEAVRKSYPGFFEDLEALTEKSA
ncbi:MAG: 3-phosphoshikimate 1-carboxyvinyltransferase [Planctomycetota bacterium]|jgi:3-phosphoshikimate 1-carboxyvinyltransferase